MFYPLKAMALTSYLLFGIIRIEIYALAKRYEVLMSLVECPECGKSISRIAEACPKCGFPAALFFGFQHEAGSSNEEESYRTIASNPETPLSLLNILSRSEDWEERRAVALNPAAPFAILASLSHDADEDVRAAVAANGNVPIPILEQLADDNCRKVVEAVADNQGTPEYIASAALDALLCAESRDENSDCDDYDWYDDPADSRDLPTGYYESRSGDFYVDDWGNRCDVMDTTEYGGMRMYYDEDNSAWIEC